MMHIQVQCIFFACALIASHSSPNIKVWFRQPSGLWRCGNGRSCYWLRGRHECNTSLNMRKTLDRVDDHISFAINSPQWYPVRTCIIHVMCLVQKIRDAQVAPYLSLLWFKNLPFNMFKASLHFKTGHLWHQHHTFIFNILPF